MDLKWLPLSGGYIYFFFIQNCFIRSHQICQKCSSWCSEEVLLLFWVIQIPRLPSWSLIRLDIFYFLSRKSEFWLYRNVLLRIFKYNVVMSTNKCKSNVMLFPVFHLDKTLFQQNYHIMEWPINSFTSISFSDEIFLRIKIEQRKKTLVYI